MERYDPARNAWVKVKPMSVGRRSPGVLAHRGKLYAVGGMGEKEDLKSVEVYDPIVNRWTKLPHTMREICGESDFHSLRANGKLLLLTATCNAMFENVAVGHSSVIFTLILAHLESQFPSG